MTPARPTSAVASWRVGGRAGAVVVGMALVGASAGPAWAAPDPYRSQQWNIERIGAPSAWAIDESDQVVAIVDSGVDLEHPDLVDRFVRDASGAIVGLDLVDDDGVPDDPLGHGTLVAGIAAATADNGIGVAGTSPQARLLPVRVLDEEGRGTTADVDAGIRWAVDNGATVVNLSLESAGGVNGGSLLGNVTSAPVAAVQYAWNRGVVVVAAAGNSGDAFTDYPASSPVVLVGATDRDDRRAEFSDTGRDDLLMAPGVDIVSTWCQPRDDDPCWSDERTYGIADGTSFAAPHVAGAVALVRAAGLSHDEAVTRLRDSARDLAAPGRDDGTGYGLLDLQAATAGLLPSSQPTTPAPTTPAPTATPDPSPTSTPTPSASATDPPPTTSPAPTATPDPSPSPSGTATTVPTAPSSPDGEVTTPDGEASPVAFEDAGRAGSGWKLLAVVLVAVTAVASGGAAAGARRRG